MATVGIRKAGSPAYTPNAETTIEDAGNWRQAAVALYRKASGRRSAATVHGSFYAGSTRPYGTYHVQFGTNRNPTGLSETYIVNVDN